eukprot:1449518-Alexandrium_andersonii.AAC.1
MAQRRQSSPARSFSDCCVAVLRSQSERSAWQRLGTPCARDETREPRAGAKAAPSYPTCSPA